MSHVQVFDQPTVNRGYPGSSPRGLLERIDDAAGVINLFRRRREHAVANLHLTRVDQRLVIEAELARLTTFCLESL